MFNYPATELFNQSGGHCVTWSEEEYNARLAEGWTEQRTVEPVAAMIQDQPEPKRRGKGGA